jgi:hypothetical protein
MLLKEFVQIWIYDENVDSLRLGNNCRKHAAYTIIAMYSIRIQEHCNKVRKRQSVNFQFIYFIFFLHQFTKKSQHKCKFGEFGKSFNFDSCKVLSLWLF